MEFVDIRTLKEVLIRKGTRVIVWADFDVPMEDGKIANDFRMRAVLPTMRFLLQKGAKIRIISKLGHDKALPMIGISRHLEKLLARKVIFIKNPFEPSAIKNLSHSSEIIFFENIDFQKGEKKRDTHLAEKLAKWGEVFVNEAFASSHRDRTSMTILPRLLPSYAGLTTEREIKNLAEPLKKPRRPFVAVFGGVKLATKLPLIRYFLKKADVVLVGGAIANSLLGAKKFETGLSRIEPFFEKLVLHSKKLHLPIDVSVARPPLRIGKARDVPVSSVAKKDIIVDIGPRTTEEYMRILKKARTVVWNGPMSMTPTFFMGTGKILKCISRTKAFTIIGGGDSLAALHRTRVSPLKFDHVSTGGGAMLEFLAGKKLPGIEALKRKNRK